MSSKEEQAVREWLSNRIEPLSGNNHGHAPVCPCLNCNYERTARALLAVLDVPLAVWVLDTPADVVAEAICEQQIAAAHKALFGED